MEVRRSSALFVRLDCVNAESSLLRSEAGDLRRELEKLCVEREASEAALRRELDVATRHAADAETAFRVMTDFLNRATEELGALDGEFLVGLESYFAPELLS